MKWLSIMVLFGLLMTQANPADLLTVTQDGNSLSTIDRSEHNLGVFPLINMDTYNQWVDQLDRISIKKPENARIAADGQIEEGHNGYRLDRRKMLILFCNYYYGKGPAMVELPTYILHPKVDAEILTSIRTKPIGYYVTYFNSNNKNRSHNIALAAKAIDSTVVFPGETFSFNEVVGMRTIEKGYKRAGIIVRGELSEGVGGGICQVSSTLFNAIDRAGLQIVKRYSHSRNVPYVLSGRDATVSWGGPDFAFQNAYNEPILIRAYSSGGQIAVSVYSSEFIEYQPRHVPGMSKHLPEEIVDRRETSVNGK
ncbi:VanW family protein [Paenibacillus provencensis]|uniref:VanW family protein n=1 Tax=Paenibacillus provencensis TaxID=441151 RepID=A0ABW3PV67_9BACL|nr:VanW family protein [Paenibacillus sp. MER 78]